MQNTNTLPISNKVLVVGGGLGGIRTALDLAEAGVGTVLWATGYALDYGWLAVDTFDDKGRPIHQRGVSQVPGIYFLGLPWQSRRGSSFIWGVWHDAKFIADQIAIQRGYMAYHDAAQPVAENA